MKDMIGQQLNIGDFIITGGDYCDIVLTKIDIIVDELMFIAIDPISESTEAFYSNQSFKISPFQVCLAKIFDPERFKTL